VANPSDTSALILDGGRASRYGGAHKAFLQVEGEAIAARALRILRPLVTEVLVATSRPDPWRPLGVRLVEDVLPGAGPLSGIAAGLAAATTPLLLVVAGDMPHLSPHVIIHLVREARVREGCVVVPRRGGRAEPLHAVYPMAAASAARAALDRGVRKLTDFLAELDVRWVDDAELAAIEGGDRTFLNVNSPSDTTT
jgi:molybdopterin-guanine dinucleotide biosynthesis protein A